MGYIYRCFWLANFSDKIWNIYHNLTPCIFSVTIICNKIRAIRLEIRKWFNMSWFLRWTLKFNAFRLVQWEFDNPKSKPMRTPVRYPCWMLIVNKKDGGKLDMWNHMVNRKRSVDQSICLYQLKWLEKTYFMHDASCWIFLKLCRYFIEHLFKCVGHFKNY